jgi:hypothetical protein
MAVEAQRVVKYLGSNFFLDQWFSTWGSVPVGVLEDILHETKRNTGTS